MKTLFLIASMFVVQDPAATVPGRVTVDDGSPLPTVTRFNGPAVQFGIQASVPGIPGLIGRATMSADGSFVLSVMLAAGTGEVAITATGYPLGYHVKSINYGPTDLTRSPLRITSAAGSTEIRVVLTKTPPAGTSAGVKVSGRVTNFGDTNAVAGLPISVQSTQTSANGRQVLRMDQTTVKQDGTFEISGVPPGRYSIRTESNQLRELDIADRDVSGLELELMAPRTLSIAIVSSPFQPAREPILPILAVSGPRVPLVPPAGSAMVSVAQSGNGFGVGNREGALTFFRIEQTGAFLEEKRLEGSPLAFTLSPGSYELRGYFRGCNGNCSTLGPPVVQCTGPFTLAAGQVLYAERIVQNDACTFRFSAPPQQQTQ